MESNPLQKPAIALIIAGIILVIGSLFMSFFTLSSLPPTPFGAGDAAMKYSLVRAGALMLAIVPFPLGATAIYGGIQMLRKNLFVMCVVGAVSAIIGSIMLAGPLALPIVAIGIWAIVVLRKPSNRNLFRAVAQTSTESRPIP